MTHKRDVWLLAACFAVIGLDGHASDAASRESLSVFAQISPSVVRIEVVRRNPEQGRMVKERVGGSGVIIDTEGHVVTNFHVTYQGAYFRCMLSDGETLEARLTGEDPLTDIAVLQLDLSHRPAGSPPIQPATFGDSSRVQTGDSVLAAGSPGGLSQTITRGIVSNPSLVLPDDRKMMLAGEDVGMLIRWIIHDAPIFPGNSGGPLVNDRGQIIGINEISLAGLGGAIPGNLVRGVSADLISGGRVVRGWSGITVQPRLQSDVTREGVVVSDVDPRSPAAQAGILAGDVILSAGGRAIDQTEEKGVALYNRLETGSRPGDLFPLVFERGGVRRDGSLRLAARQPAEAENVEFRAWGAVMRDVTDRFARGENLPDTRGVVVASIQPAGAMADADPRPAEGGVLLSVNGQPVSNVAELRRTTDGLLAGFQHRRTVLITVRNNGALIDSLVTLQKNSDRRQVTPEARQGWLGVAIQPTTPKLSARLALPRAGGARLTRIYPGTSAAAAGLAVGDVVMAINGEAVNISRTQDLDNFPAQIQECAPGSTATLALWRDGGQIDLPVTIDPEPVPPEEMPWWRDEQLEYSVRDLAFTDRVNLQLGPGAQGVLVDASDAAGWASLAGLRAGDVVIKANGSSVTDLARFRSARDQAIHAKSAWLVLLVRRRAETSFVEINLKSIVR